MQVGGHGPNAVELAIDWLTTHPAEVEAATAPAASPAAAGAEGSGEPSAEEKQLAAVLQPRPPMPEPAAAAPGEVRQSPLLDMKYGGVLSVCRGKEK